MLESGRQLGRYQVRSLIGVGGMGEVYLANDESLGRSVAIKTLPADFDTHGDRVMRFEREARLLASLSHPNIAAVHGFEQSDGLRYLVLEHVEGLTLQEKLTGGPLALDEALDIARQIALALEAAHGSGVVHRDLKPANIKVKPDDTVKVLDFGLAKATDAAVVGRDFSPADLTANSPTVTSGATRAGVLLGTAAYMSPEQARGKSVDKRTDLWAFGCIVYEMLTGRQAFGGETISDSLANVLNREIEWSRLPAGTPPAVQRLLRRCLERDAKARLHDAADARLEIDDAIARTGEPIGSAADRLPAAAMGARRAPWIVAAGTSLVAAVAVGWAMVAQAPSADGPASDPTVRFSVGVPEVFAAHPGFALSPDGQTLVVAVGSVALGSSAANHLEVRRLDRIEPEPVRGSEGASRPFFLSDGRRVGFFHLPTSEIRIVDLVGGVARTVASGVDRYIAGMSPGPDDSIIYSAQSVIKRISTSGGVISVVAETDRAKGETGFLWPRLLPDQMNLLVTVAHQDGRYSLETLSLKDATRRKLMDDAFAGAYSSGHVVFFRPSGAMTDGMSDVAGALLAAPFDVTSLKIVGEVVSTGVSNLRSTIATAVRGVDLVVGGGTFATMERRIRSDAVAGSLEWTERGGTSTKAVSASLPFRHVALSPDGTRIAAGLEGSNRDVWLFDLARDIASRFTTAEGEDETPQWSPDGRRLAYVSHRIADSRLMLARADGSGTHEELWSREAPVHLHVNDWTADGRTLYLDVRDPKTGHDVWAYSLADRSAKPFLQTPASEYGATPSPDGRWVAYVSDVSDRREVYVTDAQGSSHTRVSLGWRRGTAVVG